MISLRAPPLGAGLCRARAWGGGGTGPGRGRAKRRLPNRTFAALTSRGHDTDTRHEDRLFPAAVSETGTQPSVVEQFESGLFPKQSKQRKNNYEGQQT